MTKPATSTTRDRVTRPNEEDDLVAVDSTAATMDQSDDPDLTS
jgi:hypothetical protein